MACGCRFAESGRAARGVGSWAWAGNRAWSAQGSGTSAPDGHGVDVELWPGRCGQVDDPQPVCGERERGAGPEHLPGEGRGSMRVDSGTQHPVEVDLRLPAGSAPVTDDLDEVRRCQGARQGGTPSGGGPQRSEPASCDASGGAPCSRVAQPGDRLGPVRWATSSAMPSASNGSRARVTPPASTGCPLRAGTGDVAAA